MNFASLTANFCAKQKIKKQKSTTWKPSTQHITSYILCIETVWEICVINIGFAVRFLMINTEKKHSVSVNCVLYACIWLSLPEKK